MKLQAWFAAIATALAAATPVHAAVTCVPGERPVTINIGANPVVEDLPPIAGLPGAPTGELTTLSTAWIAADDPVHDQETTQTDFTTGTQANVGIYDGQTGGSGGSDVREAEMVSFNDNGTVTFQACIPDGINNGLVFGIYEHNDAPVGAQLSVFDIKDDVATTVLNRGTTDKVGFEFDQGGGIDLMLNNIAEATNTPVETISRSVAENLFQESLIFQYRSELEQMALFHNPTDGIVHSDKFIVTGDNASAYVPKGVTNVYDGDSNVLSLGRVTNIDGRIDTSERVGALRMRVDGYADRTITILEGRTEQDVTVDGDRIRSSFNKDSTLEGVVTLYKNGTPVKSVTDNLDETVDDGDYRIVADRILDGVDIPDWESQTYTIGTPELVEIVGLNYDADATIENPRSGDSLTDIVELACDEAIPNYTFETSPEGSYSWSDNAPAWASVDGNGSLNGTPTGNDCGTTHDYTYTVTGPDNSDSVNVTYEVAGVKPQISGIDTTFDGEPNILDADNDGGFDSTIAVSCQAPFTYQNTLLVTPDVPGNYTNSTLAPNMSFDDVAGTTTFTPNCGQIGQYYDITYTYATNEGQISQPKTAQYAVTE